MSVDEIYTSVKRALSSAPPNDQYLEWDAPNVETIKPNEEETARRIGETMNRMQQHNIGKR